MGITLLSRTPTKNRTQLAAGLESAHLPEVKACKDKFFDFTYVGRTAVRQSVGILVDRMPYAARANPFNVVLDILAHIIRSCQAYPTTLPAR